MINSAIRNGLILGVVSVLVTLFIYALDPAMLAGFTTSLSSLLIFVVLLYYFGTQMRNAQGGYWTFKQAFLAVFVMVGVSGVVGILFNLLLYNVIDPELHTVLADAATKNAADMMKRLGAPEEAIEEALTKINPEDFKFTPIKAAMGLLWYAIGAAIIALIFGAILKRKAPENFDL